jgi:FkbM family methyltransferase
MKWILKSALARTPYRLVRRTRLNRFQAVDEALKSLAGRGFNPSAVIDCGANVGAFSRTVLTIFPKAVVHAVEPQPGCLPALEALGAEAGGRLVIHPIALCAPEDDGATVRLATDAAAISTGAHVAEEGLPVHCRTIDAALETSAAAIEGALLKLDIQGYELHALRGATATLTKTDVVLTEVSFYAQAYEPALSTLFRLLADHGLELYDIASVYARPRDDRPRQADLIFVRTSSDIARDKAWS